MKLIPDNLLAAVINHLFDSGSGKMSVRQVLTLVQSLQTLDDGVKKPKETKKHGK